MKVHTGKIGDDLTLAIPKSFASELGLEPNSSVDVSLDGYAITVRPSEDRRARLADLMAKVTEQNRHGEIDTGDPVGREIW